MNRKGALYALVILPFWLFGSAMLWMFVGFGIPGVEEYSQATWQFINYGLPPLLLLGYLPVAWWVIRRQDRTRL